MRRFHPRVLPASLLFILALGAVPSARQAAAKVDAQQLMADVRMLASPEMEGRRTGTSGNQRARAFLSKRFREIGLAPVNGVVEQIFDVASGGKASNLMGMIKGSSAPDDYILVTAHFDHLGARDGNVFIGADDNASGVAAMLAAAKHFAANPPKRSMIFVGFDAEEQKLQGAKNFVEHPPVDLKRVSLIVNLDMVGRGDKNEIYVAGTHHTPRFKPIVEKVAKGRKIVVKFGHDRPRAQAGGVEDWTHSSDHGPFHDAGVPFLYFGVEDHPDYHKPTDTADKIPVPFYTEAVALVIDTLNVFANEPQAAMLSPDERAMMTFIDAHNADALALLERVVNINSGSLNLTGVRAVGDAFRKELDALGFKTRWVEGAAFKRAGHLVADHPGPGPRLLLIGHLDTVFEPDSPFQKFQRVDDRYAKGPGVIDMKGGNVVMIQALKALQSIGALKTMNVTIVMTGDEELTGEPLSAAREALVTAAKGADMAIGFEDGPGDPKTAVVARRGTTGWQLRIKAKPAHSSQIFRADIGSGAIYEAARILNAFREELKGEEYLTFNPGVILGGTSVEFDAPQSRGTAFGKENVVAEHAVVAGDLRTLSADQLARVQQKMRDIVSRSLPHAQATITFDEGYPPLAPTEGNRKLLALYDQASRDVGAGAVSAVTPDRAGAADVSFVAGHVKMVLDGVGLMGHSDHTVDETADLHTLPSQTKRAAVFLYRLSRGAAK